MKIFHETDIQHISTYHFLEETELLVFKIFIIIQMEIIENSSLFKPELSLGITVGKSSHYIKYKKQPYEIKNFSFQIINPCWLMKTSQKLFMHRRRWFCICLLSVSWTFLWWVLWLIGHPDKFTTSPLQSRNTMSCWYLWNCHDWGML